MTKPFKQRPTRQLQLVKLNDDEEVYEYWLVEPRYIGTLVRHGTQRLTTLEGAGPFSNHNGGLKYLLEKAGLLDMVKEIKLTVKTPQGRTQFSMKGAEIAAQHKWQEFCTLRKLESSPKTIGKRYKVTQEEADQLGIEVPG